MAANERILGIQFFNGTAAEALRALAVTGGCVMLPPSPALTKLRYDDEYRHALQQADLVLPDSGLLALLWRLISGHPIRKISGIDYLSHLLEEAAFRADNQAVWVLSSEEAKEKAVAVLGLKGIPSAPRNFHVISEQSGPEQSHALLLEIESRRPGNIVVALRGGVQEKLGIYLRDYLLYRPRIHCVGAALGFLSGDETRIPPALERRNLGWLARLAAQPGMILPRLGIAFTVALMVLRYRSELPPLRRRWADV